MPRRVGEDVERLLVGGPVVEEGGARLLGAAALPFQLGETRHAEVLMHLLRDVVARPNWQNDMLCTRPDGSRFYTDYEGAAAYEASH